MPALSDKLEEVRMSMKQFMDTLKAEQKLKKSQNRSSNLESQRSMMESQQTVMKERDDITHFITMVIEDHN